MADHGPALHKGDDLLDSLKSALAQEADGGEGAAVAMNSFFDSVFSRLGEIDDATFESAAGLLGDQVAELKAKQAEMPPPPQTVCHSDQPPPPPPAPPADGVAEEGGEDATHEAAWAKEYGELVAGSTDGGAAADPYAREFEDCFDPLTPAEQARVSTQLSATDRETLARVRAQISAGVESDEEADEGEGEKAGGAAAGAAAGGKGGLQFVYASPVLNRAGAPLEGERARALQVEIKELQKCIAASERCVPDLTPSLDTPPSPSTPPPPHTHSPATNIAARAFELSQSQTAAVSATLAPLSDASGTLEEQQQQVPVPPSLALCMEGIPPEQQAQLVSHLAAVHREVEAERSAG